MELTDQLNRKIVLRSAPKRIVSLVPSQTELLVDLGLENALVGITKFCVHPSFLRETKTIVGGTKKVNYAKIIQLRPDIIICNKEENTKEMVIELEKIAPVWVSNIFTIDDNLKMIEQLGQLFDKEKKAWQIISTIQAERDKFLKDVCKRPVKKAAYLIWKNPYLLAGKNTFINELLSLNRFENIISQPTSRYPETTIKQLQEADVILLSTEPYPFKQKDVVELIQITKRKVVLVNGEFFSWYGSRLIKAFEYFKTIY